MSLNFVAIDIETAAAQWNTICSISLVRVINNQIIDVFSSLVNPECEFLKMNVRIHGITADMVKTAPRFCDIATHISDFIGDSILVAHNISFDGQVLKRTFNRYNIILQSIRTCCSLLCAKTLHPEFDCFRLDSLCRHYNIQLSHHHDAADDARACALLMIAMADEFSIQSIEDLMRFANINFGSIDSESATNPYFINGNLPHDRSHELSSHHHNSTTLDYHFTRTERCSLKDILNAKNPSKGFREGFPVWEYGDKLRIQGRIEDAIIAFNEARDRGYDAPVLYSSYAKAFRKLKDYKSEIEIINEFLNRNPYDHADEFICRREKAMELLNKASAPMPESKPRKAQMPKPIEEIKERARIGRSILQCDDNGVILCEFESIAAAVRISGINSKSIRDAANGVQKHAGGYCWKYKD